MDLFVYGTLRHDPLFALVAGPGLGAVKIAATLRDHAVDRALPLYAGLRRWHLFSYQAMSAVLTPMYQSHRRALPVLRDHLLAPLARLPPVRRLLTSLVTGDLLPPMAGIAWPPQRSPARLPETAEGAT